VIPWHETEHLLLDMDGHLWERYRRGRHWRGPVAEAEVSPGLEGELAECQDLWADRIDPKAEQDRAFHLGTR
jgi:hypothetical protein